MSKQPKLKTVQEYKKWNGAKWGLYAGMWASPVIPASIMTAINWDEWFAKSGVSLPFGFSMLLVSTLLAIVLIWKKDDIMNKAISAVFYLALLFACLGGTMLFLASLYTQVGYMFLLTAGGLVVSGVSDQINKTLVKPNVDYYKELIANNQLDAKSKRRAEREEQARRDAEEDKARLSRKEVKF